MPKIAALFALALLGLPAVAWCDDAPDTQPATTQTATDPAGDATQAKATIDEAVGLLDKKDYGGFLERFIPPDSLKKIKSTPGEFDAIKADFPKEDADQMYKALQACQKLAPVIVSDTEITYPCKLAGDKRDFKLIKIDGKWYIGN